MIRYRIQLHPRETLFVDGMAAYVEHSRSAVVVYIYSDDKERFEKLIEGQSIIGYRAMPMPAPMTASERNAADVAYTRLTK